MPKRKRQDQNNVSIAAAERRCQTPYPKSTTLRRSTSLQEIEEKKHLRKEEEYSQLSSPSISDPHSLSLKGKSEQPLPYNASLEETEEHRHRCKKPKTFQPREIDTDNPTAYWALNKRWPVGYADSGYNMGSNPSVKRKSESSHRTERLERMHEHGIIMMVSNLLQKESKQMCDRLLEGRRTPVGFPCWPADRRRDVMERVQSLPESRIQRDVLPLVVPSAENLHFCGEPGLDLLGDEIQTEWTKCATMGSSRPKPDFVVGLRRNAFERDVFEKLRNYSSPFRPFLFTPDICYPFLIAEAKTGDVGLAKADRQNIHSASIAVKSIIELYRAAYGKHDAHVKQLYGQALVFTISHNHDQVHIYTHFAVPVEGTDLLKFYRCQIALISLTMFNGRDQDIPYNFTRNLYEEFAPQHLQRIREAATKLGAAPSAVISDPTRLSLQAPRTSLEDTASEKNSQEAPSQDVDAYSNLSMPIIAPQESETAKLREQMDKLLQQIEQQREQMEQQWKDSQQQLKQQREQMDQQREQLEQQKEIISLLKESRRP